jgi:hypothetical protein
MHSFYRFLGMNLEGLLTHIKSSYKIVDVEKIRVIKMTIPESKRNDTLYTKIAGERISVKIEYIAIENSRLSFIVANREDALTACFCCQGQTSKIDKTTDSRYIVTIFKK